MIASFQGISPSANRGASQAVSSVKLPAWATTLAESNPALEIKKVSVVVVAAERADHSRSVFRGVPPNPGSTVQVVA